MTRHPEWEKRLKTVVEAHRAAPWEWGVSDCFMFAVEAHEAVRGEKLLPKLRRYRTEKGGYKLFARHGFTMVGQAFGSVLDPVNRLSARRGDLCTIERDAIEACGVVTSIGVQVKTDAGMVVFPLSEIKQAYRVG